MNLIKTSLLNGIAVIVRILTLLGLNKILAIYVGPAGYGALGQFQSAVQLVTMLAGGAINTGVTKYTAEYHEDEAKQQAVWRTAGTSALIGSLLIGVLVLVFNRALAAWFLKDEELGGVFIWFAATLILSVFNTLLLAILNGKKEIRRYVLASISGSLFALLITTAMAIQFGLYGALVALAIYQSMAFFATFWISRRTTWFQLRYLIGKIDKQAAKNLAKFIAMALTSAACVPLSHVLIRNHLGETLGWKNVGYWEAMSRLSTAYLMLITTTLSVYYLPKLSELRTSVEIRTEILRGYKIILPVTAGCGLIIYLSRTLIVQTLFTEEFSSMETLFAWQMIGDTLKIGSWILAFLMLAKAMTKAFIITEIISSISFYILTIALVEKMQLQGAVIAYACNYFLYWITVAFVVIKFGFKQDSHAS